jgi:hypothetical protein
VGNAKPVIVRFELEWSDGKIERLRGMDAARHYGALVGACAFARSQGRHLDLADMPWEEDTAAAPSQETETRCEHPAAAVTEYRDGHKRCSACAALWYGDENGGWRSEGKEAPAPAPSAATDTGRIDEDRIEAMPGGDLFIHSARCEGGCDYDCGTFVHQRCGGEWNGRGDHRCASSGAGGADAKGAKP